MLDTVMEALVPLDSIITNKKIFYAIFDLLPSDSQYVFFINLNKNINLIQSAKDSDKPVEIRIDDGQINVNIDGKVIMLLDLPKPFYY